MADFESLGDDKLNPKKFLFLGVLIFGMIVVLSVLVENISKISQSQFTLLLNSLLFPLLAIGSFTAVSVYIILTGKKKNTALWIIFGLTLIASVYFIRESVTFFATSSFPVGLDIAIIYTMIGSVSLVYIVKSIIFPDSPIFDSVTSEDKSENIFNLGFKSRLLIGVGLIIFTIFYVTGTGQAFIQAPNFALTEFGILDTQLGNAILSGIVGGIIETAFFFAVLMPFIHTLAFRFTSSGAFASIISLVAISIIFILFHTTVYAYSEIALLSVGIFGFLNAMIVLVFRDNFQNMMWHFSNNFLVILFSVTTFSIILA